MSKKVLDVCCSVKGMWFDKQDKRALFIDKRKETHIDTYPCGTKTNIIDPDVIGDFTDIKQADNTFWHVVFDPPHIQQKTESQITKKYGSLQGDWRDMLKKGFVECFRVLKPNGTVYILNHFTPNNWLRHIDNSFQIISKLFHFKSVFHIDSLVTIKKFKLLKTFDFGKLSYFKLLIYSKV